MPAAAVQLITPHLIESVLDQARRSPRLRANHNFHPTLDDNPHRFLNAILRGAYIAPHRHVTPPKSESFLVLQGRLAFFIFDDSGRIDRVETLGPDAPALGIDIAPGVWHTLAVMTDYAVCYEVKPGPYSAAADKEFAPWAPREGDVASAAYLAGLLDQIRT